MGLLAQLNNMAGDGVAMAYTSQGPPVAGTNAVDTLTLA